MPPLIQLCCYVTLCQTPAMRAIRLCDTQLQLCKTGLRRRSGEPTEQQCRRSMRSGASPFKAAVLYK